MIPFSNSACPRLTPSSGLLISPISVSQDTNSLQRGAGHTQLTLSGCKHLPLRVISQPQETLLEARVKTCKQWYLYPVASFPTFLEEMLCRRSRLFPSLPLAHRQCAHKRKDDPAASIRMMQIRIFWSNPDIHGGKD